MGANMNACNEDECNLCVSQTGALLNALVQLCHISTPLAEKTWVQLFPRLWKILSDRQQHVSHYPLYIWPL